MLERAPEFKDIKAWINSPSLTMAGLRGKVVCIDAWTYSCINCQRTIPHHKALWECYRQLPFVFIGLHTPEFSFERDVGNVEAAVRRMGIPYPVAVDSDNTTWRLYGDTYWPRLWVVAPSGYILYDHAGEGGYAEIEDIVREGLKSLRGTLPPRVTAEDGEERDLEDFGTLRRISPETYAGSRRNRGLGNAQVCFPGSCIRFLDLGPHERDVIYLQGDWTQEPEYVRFDGEEGHIAYRFFAREVNMVMAPSEGPVEVGATLDGKPISKDLRGRDVAGGQGETIVKVDRPDMYRIVSAAKGREGELRLAPHSRGLRIFACTFG